MKKLLILSILVYPLLLVSQNYVSSGNGTDYSDANNWDCDGNSPCPTAPSTSWNNLSIVINHPMTVSGNIVAFGNASNVVVNSDLTINNRLNIFTNPTISGTGSITVGADFNYSNSNSPAQINVAVLNVGGNMSLGTQNTGINFDADITINGDLNGGVKGGNDVFFNGDLTILNDAIFTERGDYFFAQTVTISDELRASGDDGTLNFETGSSTTITNDMVIDNNYSYNIDGTVSVGGNVENDSQRSSSIAGSLSLGGDFTMTSNTSSSDVNVSGNLSVGGDIEITGNGLFETETGATISATDLTVNSNASDAGVLNDGAITLSGEMTLTGNAKIDCDGVDPTGTIAVVLGDCALCTSSTGGSCVLPIELSFFNVELNNGTFEFTWQTFSEENNDYFTIQYSNDGENFYPLATIDGAGNSNEILDYTYFDSELLPTGDVVYFKLVQTDFDGTSSESYIVPVSLEGLITENEFSFYPNPVDDLGHIKMTRYVEGKVYSATIINILTYTTECEFVIEEGVSDIDLTLLIPGVYLVKIDGFDSVAKIVVE